MNKCIHSFSEKHDEGFAATRKYFVGVLLAVLKFTITRVLELVSYYLNFCVDRHHSAL